MDPAETYRKLNAELIKQVQENKLKQRLFEMKNLQLEQQSIIHQQIIREQKIIIEAFVNQNSQDLTVLLAQLVEGQKQNMTVVTEFVQNMLLKLQSLLIHISTDSSARGAAPLTSFLAQRPAATPPQPATQPVPSAVTVRSVRAHRSLSPVVRRDAEADQEEEGGEPNNELRERPSQEMFVTRRRRNNTPRNSQEVEDEMETAEPQCEPFTLPDGMLSTIPEIAGKQLQQTQQEEEDKDSEEEFEDQEEEEEEDSVQEDEEEEIECQVDEPDQENISIDKTPPAIVVAATRRKRMLSSRSVLSPVDPNQVEARVKRTRTPMPRNCAEVVVAPAVEEDEQPQEISLTCRPRRKAAPSTLVEPSRRVKMRR